jgi:hypothetical protein
MYVRLNLTRLEAAQLIQDGEEAAMKRGEVASYVRRVCPCSGDRFAAYKPPPYTIRTVHTSPVMESVPEYDYYGLRYVMRLRHRPSEIIRVPFVYPPGTRPQRWVDNLHCTTDDNDWHIFVNPDKFEPGELDKLIALAPPDRRRHYETSPAPSEPIKCCSIL